MGLGGVGMLRRAFLILAVTCTGCVESSPVYYKPVGNPMMPFEQANPICRAHATTPAKNVETTDRILPIGGGFDALAYEACMAKVGWVRDTAP